ncbi:MAG: amidohydrolase family protein, partial [Thermoanaerobaculia bacterium]|nr:amidohydrolase family protein [Thermoanaerobaculia bacterium]
MDRRTASLHSLLSLLVGCGGGPPPAGPERPAPELVIDGARLLDPESGEIGAPAAVSIRDGRILEVTAAPYAAGSASAEAVEVVDAGGHFLMPGLWDLHVHLGDLDDSVPPLLVTQGVTAVRDMGGHLDRLLPLRERIRRGELLGPRILMAGPTLNGAPNAPFHRVIEDAEAARAAVAELADVVDFFKTHNATGREAWLGLLEAARGHGKVVAGHVPTGVSPLEACEAGQASIEHIATIFEGTYVASFESELEAFQGMESWLAGEAPGLADCFAAHGTLFVPTLRAYERRALRADDWDHPDPRWRYVGEELRERGRAEGEPTEIDRDAEIISLRLSLVEAGVELVRLLHERGAPVGAGVDLGLGMLPGFDLHAEIRLLAQAGLTPAEAIRTATSGPGAAAGADPLTGQIEA